MNIFLLFFSPWAHYTFYLSQYIDGADIVDFFCDEYENFTVYNFDRTYKDYRQYLKKILRERDVFLPYITGVYSLSKKLSYLVTDGYKQ